MIYREIAFAISDRDGGALDSLAAIASRLLIRYGETVQCRSQTASGQTLRTLPLAIGDTQESAAVTIDDGLLILEHACTGQGAPVCANHISAQCIRSVAV